MFEHAAFRHLYTEIPFHIGKGKRVHVQSVRQRIQRLGQRQMREPVRARVHRLGGGGRFRLFRAEFGIEVCSVIQFLFRFIIFRDRIAAVFRVDHIVSVTVRLGGEHIVPVPQCVQRLVSVPRRDLRSIGRSRGLCLDPFINEPVVALGRRRNGIERLIFGECEQIIVPVCAGRLP